VPGSEDTPVVTSGRAVSEDDQTASERDQTASDEDQAASDGDQLAADEDQIASDLELAPGTSGQMRRKISTRRDHATQICMEHSRARLDSAATRDVTAEQRARMAAARDRTADWRDRVAESRDGVVAPARAVTTEQMLRVARDRRRAADDRANAAEDRLRATTDASTLRVIVQWRRRDRVQSALDRQASEVDELTHVRRRGAGMEQLAREVDRARRGGEGLVVAFIDVDGLKRVNDTEGHLAGDALLIAVADSLRACLRSYDLVMRVGGDEFVCALPNSSLEQVRGRFEEVSRFLGAGPAAGSVTVGFTELLDGDRAEDLIRRADADLLARRGGG
jgi:diguanylate cyclase (GGDEF)-like protein